MRLHYFLILVFFIFREEEGARFIARLLLATSPTPPPPRRHHSSNALDAAVGRDQAERVVSSARRRVWPGWCCGGRWCRGPRVGSGGVWRFARWLRTHRSDIDRRPSIASSLRACCDDATAAPVQDDHTRLNNNITTSSAPPPAIEGSTGRTRALRHRARRRDYRFSVSFSLYRLAEGFHFRCADSITPVKMFSLFNEYIGFPAQLFSRDIIHQRLFANYINPTTIITSRGSISIWKNNQRFLNFDTGVDKLVWSEHVFRVDICFFKLYTVPYKLEHFFPSTIPTWHFF